MALVFPSNPSVDVQIDDLVRPMTHEEWDTWIEQQVGTEKLSEQP